MFETASPLHKHLHVGLTPRRPQAGTQSNEATPIRSLTLLGEADLPKPPVTSTGSELPVWYDSDYRGYPVRVVTLKSEVLGGRGQRFDPLVQAAESTSPRDDAQAATLQQQLLRDGRMLLVVIVLVWLVLRHV